MCACQVKSPRVAASPAPAPTRGPDGPPLQAVAAATGVVLDPVYSGKAVHALLREVRADPGAWRGRTVLFVHTGGLLVRGRAMGRLWGGVRGQRG